MVSPHDTPPHTARNGARSARNPRRRSSRPERAVVDVGPLDPAQVVAVARYRTPVALAPAAEQAIAVSRAVVEALAGDSAPHYGISTGFGALATTHIAAGRRAALQTSLIRSHAAGTGTPVETEVVRAMMLLRLSTLATGRTGVKPATAAALAGLLNAGITPIVPEYGSLGCSGDLAPLATVALALIGEGEVIDATGPAPAGRSRAGRGRPGARRAGREGRPGPDQRHRRHARHAAAGAARHRRSARPRRRLGGDER